MVRWGDGEDAIVREEYAGGSGYAERAAARLPDRTLRAVQNRAKRLALTPGTRHIGRTERRKYYGDAKTVSVMVRMPEPLAAWLDEFARQRGVARNSLILAAIDLWAAMTYEYIEDYGVTIEPPPGQYALDSPWHPDNQDDQPRTD